MGKVEFTIYKDLKRVNANSLLLDSDEEVASLQVGKFYLSLMTRGEKEVWYKEESYKNTIDYPQIVIDYFLGNIKDKKILDELDDDIYVDSNNWYMAELYIVLDKEERKNRLDGVGLISIDRVNDYEDVFDLELEHCEQSMSEMLYSIMLRHLKNLKEYYQDEVEELKELDLSNL